MTIEQAYEAIAYRGDSVEPLPGEHDVKQLVAEVVSRLPDDVRQWLLVDTHHVFIGGHGQMGEFMPLFFPPGGETLHDMMLVRVIFLSDGIGAEPRDDGLWTVAHEIAHSRLNHGTGLPTSSGIFDDELSADKLAGRWGFAEPVTRAVTLASYGPGR